MRIVSVFGEFVMPTTGGDAVRFPPIYGEFAMTTVHRPDIWLKFP